MLFNSYAFLLLFLPLVFGGYLLLARLRLARSASVWLLFASLFFYGYWEPRYLLLIGVSILWNYGLGVLLARGRHGSALLAVGIVANLGLLGYFKYANFFLQNAGTLVGAGFEPTGIVLPLAISFFTFQQIAYLVDTRRDRHAERSLLHYALFVTFFPQLIAGPIVRREELLPQLLTERWGINASHIAQGFAVISIGLFKKVVIADSIAPTADALFGFAAQGGVLSFAEAWVAALAFTFQLYFDFSGYADIAIGLALMFDIRLPQNFHSPYKAANLIDFWRRWHITLSRFLRDYLYIPLGGRGRHESERTRNLLVTMLLGGLWHGAGWTYVVWGAWHGAGLALNHAWRRVRGGQERGTKSVPGMFVGTFVTYLFVVFGWVLFRAQDLATSRSIMASMVGLHGVDLPLSAAPLLGGVLDGARFGGAFPNALFATLPVVAGVLLLQTFVWLLPNTQAFMGASRAALVTYTGHFRRHAYLRWVPGYLQGGVMAAAFCLSLLLLLGWQQQFVYFQF